MLCNVCGKNEATIHLTEIVNGQMLELHVCEGCSQDKGSDLKNQFSLNELLSGLNELSPFVASQKKEALVCRTCALTYEEFSKSGRLGCPDCYYTFLKSLLPLIKKVQKDTRHLGKRPSKIPAENRAHIDLSELQERLRKSIEMEEFEKAAQIRDEIRQLEEKTKKSGKKNG